MSSPSIYPQPDFKLLFEAAPALFMVLAPDLTLVAFSDAYLKATMIERETTLGRNIFDVFPDNPDDASATGVGNLRASLERVLKNHVVDVMAVQKYDVRRPASEGGGFEERFWSPINSPVFDDDHNLTYIIHRAEDVTEFVRLRQVGLEQEKLNEELQSRAGQMEAEIFHRAQQVQEANQQLRTLNESLAQRDSERALLYEQLYRLNQLKSQLFANVSHELRTPLALLLGPTEKLLATDTLTASQRRDLEGIERNARVLLKHINDLLDVAKLESGKVGVNYTEIDLARLVRQTSSHFHSLADEHHQNYVIDTPDMVSAQVDPDKIQRILMNLLSNAFKFTPPGGRVRCTMTVDDSLRIATIAVADSGSGIPEHLRESVFERFFQAEESSTRHFGGTGLGLAIAKEFVELHGGSISVGDSPQGGALFTVTLPLYAPAGVVVQLAPAKSEKPPDELTPFTPVRGIDIGLQPAASDAPLILVVEDNLELSQYVREILSDTYRTEAAFNGQAGLEQALKLCPDLILSDMMMPLVNGAEMVHMIRQRDELSAIPIVMLTAKADDDLRVELLREGVQDYLVKPFPSEELRVRVGNLVALKRARELLIDRNDRLEQVVTDLRVANEELDAFSYSVAHDLRAPLRAIGGYTRILLEDDAAALSEEGLDYLQRIDRNTGNMDRLIDDLLTFSKLGRQPISKRNVAPDDIVQQVLQDLHAEQSGRQVEVCVGNLPAVKADPVLLKEVYLNLIGNALKYSRPRSVAQIEIGSQPDTEPVVYFVHDNGVGFDMTYASKLFEVFQRLHRPADFEGTGIGLAIVQRIVERHGGRVWADSIVNEGSTFFFTLA